MKKIVEKIKKFFCWAKWHSVGGYDIIGFDGCSVKARCRWCGYVGLVDSQGNLF